MYVYLPFYYLAQTETVTEVNILSTSAETFGNNAPTMKIWKPQMKVRLYYN